MPSEILAIHSLSKKFAPSFSFKNILSTFFRPRKPIVALNHITFSLTKGKVLGILGPNGAGKTTLLKIIATLILPDEGSVKISNYNVETHDHKIKSMIGLACGNERSFYWRLTGRQNLEFFAALYNLSSQHAQEKINDLLTIFNITYADQRFDSYSTGMKRKLSIVRALLSDPELLLLDEPTKGLDYNSKKELHGFIQDHVKGKTTAIIATHNFEEAQDLCDEFLILSQGQVCACGTLDLLKEKTGTNTLEDIYLTLTKT